MSENKTPDKQGKLSIWVEDLVALLRRWREYHRMDADIEGTSLKADLFREGDALLAQDGRWNYFPKLEAIATLESVASATLPKMPRLSLEADVKELRREGWNDTDTVIRLAEAYLKQTHDIHC